MTNSSEPDRRSVIGAALAGSLLPGPVTAAVVRAPIRALAFDAFTIFDSRHLATIAIATVGEKGGALAAAWTSKLFALSWLETSAGRYSGFTALADAALAFSASSMGIELSAGRRRDLVAGFDDLPLWPDSFATLERLRSAGLRLAFLSNLSEATLLANMRRHGLDRIMDNPISTDLVRAFKPSPRAYGLGPRFFSMTREQIGFVAFGSWDALGAKWFGYRTAWINRLAVTPETLMPPPDEQAPDLRAAVKLVRPD